jgi:hypothetical protein
MAQPTSAHTNNAVDGPSRQSETQNRNVVGLEGEPITLASLPPPDTKRWVIRRKAIVVAAVRGGLLTLAEACERYTLSVEEFLSWQQAIEHHGVAGLRTTRLQEYRAEDN